MSPEITQTGRNFWRELEAICKLPPSPEKDAQCYRTGGGAVRRSMCGASRGTSRS